MKTSFFNGLLIAFLLALATSGVALAHGEPVITVNPVAVAPGGEVVVTGSDMEAGEVFLISLENALSTIKLDEVTATGESDEAGFTITLIIPNDVAPGTYIVRAATEEGEAVTADLTVTAEGEKLSGEVMEASAEPMKIDRSKPAGQVVGIILAALFSVSLGVWLVRKPE